MYPVVTPTAGSRPASDRDVEEAWRQRGPGEAGLERADGGGVGGHAAAAGSQSRPQLCLPAPLPHRTRTHRGADVLAGGGRGGGGGRARPPDAGPPATAAVDDVGAAVVSDGVYQGTVQSSTVW
ncbi:hypothetical protein I4F81_005316 [Pyropia yezoensis]|uniref:Uncharacterized protein n=1 Tax=Pyropia yezoensis TaxID=2788 RepID=A0ACC3BYG7_PYRYE|nr:hypothetical protein I4F81_005316 [Neopyropia yezoensis]